MEESWEDLIKRRNDLICQAQTHQKDLEGGQVILDNLYYSIGRIEVEILARQQADSKK